MNLSLMNFMAILTIFVGIEETVSNEIWLSNQYFFKTALPLVQKRNSTLKLAIPQKYGRGYAAYLYDSIPNKKKRVEHLMLACPASRDDNSEIITEQDLKNTDKLSIDSKLFFMQDYSKLKKAECPTNVIPSVEKVEWKDDGNPQFCRKFNEQLYDVGYPVLRKKEKVQFVSVYKVCYSTAGNKGTKYTIHRIESPTLLLRELWKYYAPDLTKLFKSSLDNKIVHNNYFVYQLVGFQDMPINAWELTTLFSFNHAPVTKDFDVLMGMMTADNYIRVYSKKMNKPLTLYSGAYEVIGTIPNLEKMISFWRVIMDDEGGAIILVTQRTQSYYFCKIDTVPFIVRKYRNGGCTYTCPVDKDIIELLSLPKLEIKKTLDLTLIRTNPTEGTQSLPEVQQSSVSSFPQTMNISDFMAEEDFMNAFEKVDAELAKKTKVKRMTDKPWIFSDSTELPKAEGVLIQKEENDPTQDDKDDLTEDYEDDLTEDDEDYSTQDDEDVLTQDDEDALTQTDEYASTLNEEDTSSQHLGRRRKLGSNASTQDDEDASSQRLGRRRRWGSTESLNSA